VKRFSIWEAAVGSTASSPPNKPPFSREEAIEITRAWLATQPDSPSAEYAEAWLEAAKKQQLIDGAAQAIIEAYEARGRPISRERALEILMPGLMRDS
jgi:hypothetical protein